MRSGEVPPIMLDPSLLPDGEEWMWTCKVPLGDGRGGVCNQVTQGGRAGMAAHQATVHGR